MCRSLAISSNEEQLALSLQGGPAFTLALNNQELMKADDMNFELLGPGVHTAGRNHWQDWIDKHMWGQFSPLAATQAGFEPGAKEIQVLQLS
jgi:hypothetical protein